MKTWYQNRMESGVTHRGQNIPKGKKVLLTEAQAKLHNGTQEKVAKTEPPKDSSEAGVLADWSEWTKANEKTEVQKSSTQSDKEKKSLKAK